MTLDKKKNNDCKQRPGAGCDGAARWHVRVPIGTSLLFCLVFMTLMATVCGDQAAGARVVTPGFMLPGDVLQGRGLVLAYSRIGAAFSLRGLSERGVQTVYIFPPEPNLNSHGRGGQKAIGEDEVVPGVGAFGVRIGDTVRVLDSISANSWWSTTESKAEPTYVLLELHSRRTVCALVQDGRVAQIVASGSFRTPAGLTQAGGWGEVVRAYGQPSVFWTTVSKRSARVTGRLGAALAVVGLAFGFACWVAITRCRSRHTD